jgi:three-Cys-motif partner protein
MSPPPAPIDFFDEPKLASLHKLDVFGKYLVPWSRKMGSGWKHLWIVDGFAGAGVYQEGAIDGSPRLAARWARQEQERLGYPLVRCLNVERDSECFSELQANTREFGDLVKNFEGEFLEHLDGILDLIGRDPAFFFLDPFGVNGIEMATIERILERRGRKTEMLIHFSEKSFRRMAGHTVQNEKRTSVGRKVAEAKLERLDEVIGTPLWRPRWEGTVEIDAAMEKTVELYLSQLKTRGFQHAHQISIRDRYWDRTSYRLIFCTNSIHGVDVMSDRVCRYERELKETSEAGQLDFFSEPTEQEQHAALMGRIHEIGLRSGRMSREDVRHALVSESFGQYTTPDYARAIRDLVKANLIRRKTVKGISEREPLRFVERAQASLLETG